MIVRRSPALSAQRTTRLSDYHPYHFLPFCLDYILRFYHKISRQILYHKKNKKHRITQLLIRIFKITPTKVGVIFCNVKFHLVGTGLPDGPLTDIKLFCCISIVYLLSFQALMPRGTPFLSKRRQKRGKDRLFLRGLNPLHTRNIRFIGSVSHSMCPINLCCKMGKVISACFCIDAKRGF